jgi:hypothetical protein
MDPGRSAHCGHIFKRSFDSAPISGRVHGMVACIQHCERSLKGLIMSMRLLACLAVSLVIVFSGPLLAQEQKSAVEMKNLQLSLSVINAEAKSDLDQILVLQEAIKVNARTPLGAQQGRSPDPVLFEDAAAAQRLAIERETAMNTRL